MNVLIVGGSRVGAALAAMLIGDGHLVTVVEQRPDLLGLLADQLPAGCVRAGGLTDPGDLEAAGIRRADVVAAVTADDRVNLVVTCLARFEFRVPRTVARIANPAYGWMFTPEMGVDVAIDQSEIIARLVADEAEHTAQTAARAAAARPARG